MKFCAECGHAVEHRIPPGDQLPRYVCPACGTIHYQNPKIVAGCVPDASVDAEQEKQDAPTP